MVNVNDEGRLRLGFLTNVPFSSDPGGARRGLREAIELFEFAQDRGFDSGWVRQRHFDNYLASPLVLLAAVAQRTSTIRLGTAIVSIRFEDPIRLGEDASTLDLLSDGRLELGLAGGMPGYESVFGRGALPYREETQDRIRRFRDAIAGKPLERRLPPDGAELPSFFIRPRSPELDARLWYGAGSPASAARAGEQGLNLLLSTLNLDPTSESFEESQRDSILAYRAARADATASRICVSRLFMPAVTTAQRERYAEFDRIRRTEGPAGPRPSGALAPGAFREGDSVPPNVQLCPIYHGDPDRVLEAARNDAALAMADEMMVWLPPNFTLQEGKELLDNIVERVAPELGWRAGQAQDALSLT